MSVSRVQLDRIECDYGRGCPEFYEGDPIGCCYSRETRQQARALGWQVNVQQYRSSRLRLPRLDFCPKHREAA